MEQLMVLFAELASVEGVASSLAGTGRYVYKAKMTK
jgi:hypothetical protein